MNSDQQPYVQIFRIPGGEQPGPGEEPVWPAGGGGGEAEGAEDQAHHRGDRLQQGRRPCGDSCRQGAQDSSPPGKSCEKQKNNIYKKNFFASWFGFPP